MLPRQTSSCYGGCQADIRVLESHCVTRFADAETQTSANTARQNSVTERYTSLIADAWLTIDSDMGGWTLRLRPFLNRIQDFSCGIVTGNPADGAAALRAGAAKENVIELGFDSPGVGLFFSLGERKGERVMKDIAVVHA